MKAEKLWEKLPSYGFKKNADAEGREWAALEKFRGMMDSGYGEFPIAPERLWIKPSRHSEYDLMVIDTGGRNATESACLPKDSNHFRSWGLKVGSDHWIRLYEENDSASGVIAAAIEIDCVLFPWGRELAGDSSEHDERWVVTGQLNVSVKYSGPYTALRPEISIRVAKWRPARFSYENYEIAGVTCGWKWSTERIATEECRRLIIEAMDNAEDRSACGPLLVFISEHFPKAADLIQKLSQDDSADVLAFIDYK